MKGITSVSEERPYLVIAVVALITLGMVYGISQIKMTSEMEKFLPEDYTSVRVTNRVENQVRGTTSEIVLVEGDLTSVSNLREIYDLHKTISEKPKLKGFVVRVNSYPSLVDQTLEKLGKNWESLSNKELQGAIQMLRSRPDFQNRAESLVSDNRNLSLIMVTINSDLPTSELHEKTKELHQITDSFDDNHPNLEANNTGTVSMEMETQGMMEHDNQILIPGAIIVVIVILYLAFRRISDTGLPFLILGLGAVWMVGSMGLVGIPFSMVYVALVPIILGIGIDYTIHMLNRYYEERAEGITAGKSAVRSVRTVGVAIALTAVTTIIGFASFGVSDMPPIRNFGFIAAGGTLFIFALATFLLPSLLTLRDRGGESEREEREEREGGGDRIGTALSRVEKGAQRHQSPVLIIAGIITVICIFGATGIPTTMNFDTFLPSDTESVKAMGRIETHFGGQNQGYIVAEGNFSSPRVLGSILMLENSILSDPRNQGKEPLITGSSSVAKLVYVTENEKIPKSSARINKVIDNLQKTRPEMSRLLPRENQAIIYFSIQGETDDEMETATEIMRDHVREFSEDPNVNVNLELDGNPAVGGSPAVISDIMGSILPSMRNSIILAIALVGIVLAIVFKSPLIGFMGSLPVIFALFWEFGAMRALGWPLDVMNMMVSALAIGIGVDFSIHMTHRFVEEWKENDKSPEEAISVSIQSVGRAITAAAATTIGVFAVLSLSRMPPIARFGQLAGLVILFSLVSALVVLPSALLAYGKWKKK